MPAAGPPETESRPERVPACPACAETDAEELFVVQDRVHGLPGQFPLVRCRSCGLGFLRERPARSRLASYYPADGYYSYRPGVRHVLFQRRDPLARAWY